MGCLLASFLTRENSIKDFFSAPDVLGRPPIEDLSGVLRRLSHRKTSIEIQIVGHGALWMGVHQNQCQSCSSFQENSPVALGCFQRLLYTRGLKSVVGRFP